MNTDLKLIQLAQAFLDAKEEESSAIAKRRAIGKLLEEALPGVEEGTTGAKDGDFKITINRKLTRTIDSDKLSAAWGELSQNCQKAVKWKAEPVLKQLRALQDMAPAEYAELAAFITTKPASATVEVERISQE